MALDDLTGALVEEARAEAEAIVADARVRAAELERRADRERRTRVEQELASLRASCEGDARRDLAEVSGRLRGHILRTRAEALERVRVAVAARLPSLLEVPGVADALIAEAAAVAGEAARSLRCAPALIDRLRQRWDISAVADAGVGNGLVVELEGGRARVIVTLDALLERQWPALRIAALAAIDGEEDAP